MQSLPPVPLLRLSLKNIKDGPLSMPKTKYSEKYDVYLVFIVPASHPPTKCEIESVKTIPSIFFQFKPVLEILLPFSSAFLLVQVWTC